MTNCSTCDRTILETESSWVLPSRGVGPVHCSDPRFRVCNACHPGILWNTESRFGECAGHSARDIFGCDAHWHPACYGPDDGNQDWDFERNARGKLSPALRSQCKCRCAVCGAAGAPGNCGRREWCLGHVRAYATDFKFMVCPSCQDAWSTAKMRQTIWGTYMPGELSKQWFDPHLKKVVPPPVSQPQ